MTRWLLVEPVLVAHPVLSYLRSGKLETINHRLLAFSKDNFLARDLDLK